MIKTNYDYSQIPLIYKENPSIKGVLIQENSYDIQDISLLTKIPLSKLKKEYSLGLFLLENLFKAYFLIQSHKEDDFSMEFKDKEIKKSWRIDKQFFNYIKDFSLLEYCILYKYDKKILNILKYKTKNTNTICK